MKTQYMPPDNNYLEIGSKILLNINTPGIT